MERTMTVEERIRRAEDIYNRRNGGYKRISETRERPNKTKKDTAKRLLMQIFVCLLVYIIFYAVTNREHVFSEEFRNEVNTFFSEKTKISEWYNGAKGFISSKFDSNTESKNETVNNVEANKKVESNAETNKTEENKSEQKNETENISVVKKDENIGGAVEETTELSKENTNEQKNEEEKKDAKDETKKEEKLTEQQIMEKEAKEIKDKISFVLPLTGRISSTFGWRNPTTVTVPKYHTGIDIAANEGTKIKSATDGKIIMASSKGDYGNHYQIQVKDIVIVYAHCKKLYLKEGDTVKQGQEIAEVGSTGNSTGPHLHFEIRKGDKKIDPQLILNF